ncbi:MAG TPA: phenylacetate--CoA ligase [Streptosporangiaceae bacterium]|nr:phenylacetate--CoA ligase [Streptosporangiaceae bacterium]
MIADPAAETAEPGQRRALQAQRLTSLVRYVITRVPFYAERLDGAGIKPDDDLGVDDLARLPLTTKDDLRDNYPLGLLAVPAAELARIHASSGTTGKPTVVAYTAADLDLFAEVVARCLAMAGAEPAMMLHNAYGYGLFTGGLGLHAGAERLRMTVVPVSSGMTERQLTLISDLRPDVIAATPSYALTLAQAFRERGTGPADISLRYALLGAEPWTEAMRTEIDAALGVRSTNIYGLSEIIGPGVANECVEARAGSHINEDHFLPEIVDPQTGDVLADGQEGVLVLTTLTKQAMPLLRYWTGDITSLSHDPCACGRTLVRMAPIKGRADDMLIVRGVNVYPTQVGEVLSRVPGSSPHFQLVVTREATLDELEVRVEVTEEYFRAVAAEVLSEDVIEADHTLRAHRDQATRLLHETIGIHARVTLVAPGETPRSQGGKLQRVDDRRHLG